VSHRASALIDAIDHLYERVMDDPEGFDEQDVAEWYGETLSVFDGPLDRQYARWVRRATRLALRLGRYWSDADRAGPRPVDWRNGVDQAHGPAGWQPSLEIARRGLELEPTQELYEEMQNRFREVMLQPWLDLTWEEWLADSEGSID
jgi:hypothetical protein